MDVRCLEYQNEKELIIIHFNGGGSRKVDITADSEIALIRDVISKI
ncbi:MAG: hypothetical protein PHY47_16150 [Lachnospiraceae bacterium]|nr:hypothetical protein [Lachnospiraceae bacterium]